ncbi:glycosyltransferase family 2 protein [Methylocaldum sp. RMAD-M]|jgi:glycosyltransferase involved in cell wall biosynthesis|uniref:glycosyltransferase family 2 protein n=1 Tax=Methylocaldum sp. RMAD-M TaxID=2806557 RepID=UPI00143D3E3F|nr:glycosyltransferase family 2 protein [Methylocaldum sp. RMAD-M]MBP1152813.1 glycosyltransferase involved in cell wall biosynthesis [Methylocaldum sp. RMAD-M]
MPISIAMATYNGERFIREQLDSLARQTQLPHELVVTDDGSTDRTLEILVSFAKTAPFEVRIYRNERTIGYGDNFLKAASLCEGDWVAFCDQDDIWKENKLEVISRKMAPDVLLIVHSADLVDADLSPTGHRLPDIKKDCVQEALASHPMKIFPGCCMVFQTALLSLADRERRPAYSGENADKLTHDWWVYIVANVLGNIGYIGQSLMLYRRHQWTVSGPVRLSMIERVRQSNKIRSREYCLIAETATNIARYLEMLSQQRNLNDRKFAIAADLYRRHAYYLRERSKLYELGNSLKRLGRVAYTARKGAYRPPRFGGLGLHALFKDIFYLLILNNSLSKIGFLSLHNAKLMWFKLLGS